MFEKDWISEELFPHKTLVHNWEIFIPSCVVTSTASSLKNLPVRRQGVADIQAHFCQLIKLYNRFCKKGDYDDIIYRLDG